MKYILIVSCVYPPEPVVSAKLSKDLYQCLVEKGYSVKVLHPKPTRPNGFDFGSVSICGADEVTVDSFVCPQMSKIGRIRESLSFGKACLQYIKEHNGDISCVYVNSWPMFSQSAIVKISKKYGIPCIVHVQDVYPESLTNKMPRIIGDLVKQMLTPIDKYILRHSDRVVAISDKMKNYLADTRNIEKSKIAVVINWQDEKEFINYHQDEMVTTFTYMYMGNIGPVAGVDLLIDAFVKADIKNARLVIAGSGSMKEALQERASAYKNIEFCNVPNGKVPEIQAQADVMLLPIKKGAASSSIPSKLPAYMFSAKPIIGCVDSGSDTADAIESSNGGWVIEPENVHLLANMMIKVYLMKKEDLKSLGLNSYRYGIEHFSKGLNLHKLVEVIVNCIN